MAKTFKRKRKRKKWMQRELRLALKKYGKRGKKEK